MRWHPLERMIVGLTAACGSVIVSRSGPRGKSSDEGPVREKVNRPVDVGESARSSQRSSHSWPVGGAHESQSWPEDEVHGVLEAAPVRAVTSVGVGLGDELGEGLGVRVPNSCSTTWRVTVRAPVFGDCSMRS